MAKILMISNLSERIYSEVWSILTASIGAAVVRGPLGAGSSPYPLPHQPFPRTLQLALLLLLLASSAALGLTFLLLLIPPASLPFLGGILLSPPP